ncbi:MAG TPA: FlgD immunoglobulin-like domain containing protein [Patescibacteria group bacterium]|nr:FlgD immunoglobulin-like domain containing protein [Patescibacteria group bacterium]
MKKTLFFTVLFLGMLTLLMPGVHAQYNVPHGTFSCGGGIQSGSHFMYDTAGQGPIGVSSGGSYIVKSGFWYVAELSSTVDVAITTFEAEYSDDAVVLRWNIAATEPFEGFNVYRAEGDGEDFHRINEGLLSPESIDSYRDETAIPGRSYGYRLGAVTADGEIFSITVSLSLPPKPLTLYQNFPNPFNPSTSITFFLPEQQHVRLVVYDVEGRKIRTLCDGMRDVGKHTVLWNGTNAAGNTAGSGVYYYRLEVGKKLMTKKMVILR